MSENIRQRLINKIERENWQVDSMTIERWLQKAEEHISHYDNLAILEFQLTEILHYLKVSDLKALKIPVKSEYEYVVQLFKNSPSVVKTSSLQSPDKTFGEALKSRICIKCKVSECTVQAIQTRSADEATSYYFACKSISCGYKWKDR